MQLNENERIDDLEIQNLKIIQNKNWFCFGMDSVLLSDFAKDIKPGSKIIDLGTGTGILPILLSAKTKNTQITGVEIQENVAQMAKRSIELNNLQDRVQIICDDIKNLKNKGYFDAVVANSPYKKMGEGKVNINKEKLISRHEITATLEDFIAMAQYLLKDKGSIYLVHHPERLAEIFVELCKYNLEPKILKFVQPNFKQKPNLVLIKATKNAKSFLNLCKPTYVYDDDGKYTQEILDIYGRSQ